MITRIVSLIVIVWALGFAVFVLLLPGPIAPAPSDAIVVLTGGPGRIERGLALMQRKTAKRMLISGVDKTVKPHELAISTHAPLNLFDRVDLGHEAVDTRSNGEETARWIAARRYHTIRLVTTDWHMPRAAFELRHALPDDVVVTGDAVQSEDPGFAILLVEYNKFLLRRGAVLVGL